MNTAKLILVEGGLRTLRVTLYTPMGIAAIWDLFTECGIHPQAVTMCKGTARVIL